MVDINWFDASIVLIVFVFTYVGIVSKNIDKTISAVIGAIVSTIALQFLGVIDSETKIIEHIQTDLQIILLIFGTLVLVDVTQESGVFHFISVKILKLTEGNPKKLLRYFGALTLLLSALVNNISAMMIVGSLTIIACERLELKAKPYIVVELSMTTVGGIVTLISSVPNIIIAEKFGISFVKFFIIGAPWSIVSMLLNFIIFERLYQNEIMEPSNPEEMKDRVNEFDEWSAVKDRQFFFRSLVVLNLTILGFVFAAQLGLSLAMIAVSGGVSAVVVSGKKFDEVLAKLDWGLLAFFLGLFVLIAALDLVHLLEFLAEWLASILPKNELLASTIILWVVAIISGIVDNIVVAAAFGPVLFDVAGLLGFPPRLIAWATIFGANFGGGFTPIGAPSAVVGLAVLYKKTGEKMGWGEFFKTQGIATTVRLMATIIYLVILSFLLPVIPID